MISDGIWKYSNLRRYHNPSVHSVSAVVKTMNFNVKRISQGPHNYLFGFHDLVQTNAKGDFALALEVEDISHPPLPSEFCAAGVIDLTTGAFKKLHDTHTWNYPQGARQQWIGDSDLCVCNDRAADGTLISHIYNARTGEKVDTLPFPVHYVEPLKARNDTEDLSGIRGFYLNYDRIHSCGGYGYTPLVNSVYSVVNDIPSDDGIFVGDLDTKEHELLVSIAQVAACGEAKPVKTGYPHYLTHLMLNPSGTRLCFLHRYRVPDGGETTRLMTVGVDGSGLRCLAKGFLSHFTWISDDEVFIWGKDERALCKMREAAWLRIPGVLQLALFAKKCLRGVRSLKSLLKRQTSNVKPQTKSQDKAFLIIKDCDTPTMVKNGVGILTEDGHPMAQPGNLKFLVSDTYPNADGDRWLIFYDVEKQERANVGQFRRLFADPDPTAFDWKASQLGIDKRILKKFPRALYLFARSGYHTDLHPRWSHDGRTAFFDSIHEGTRQIYTVEAP